MAQVLVLLAVVLPRPHLSVPEALALVHYRQVRNYAAYRAHRTRTVRRHQQRGPPQDKKAKSRCSTRLHAPTIALLYVVSLDLIAIAFFGRSLEWADVGDAFSLVPQPAIDSRAPGVHPTVADRQQSSRPRGL